MEERRVPLINGDPTPDRCSSSCRACWQLRSSDVAPRLASTAASNSSPAFVAAT